MSLGRQTHLKAKAVGESSMSGKPGCHEAAKRQATLADTYIDVRHWTVADWSKHPDLMLSLSQNGQSSV